MREFKYNPKARENNIIEKRSKWFPIKCECCGNKVLEYTDGLLNAEKRIGIVCPDCISSGRAAREYNGKFIYEYEKGIVTDPSKIDELEHRTPGYVAYKEPFWLACCEDFCQFIGYVNADELDEMGIFEEVVDECVNKFYIDGKEDLTYEWLREQIGGEFVGGYLFKCLHCGRYRLYMDFDV